ncbi:MAG: decaprenylphospho-beta-D-ribofuranose 2-oxidase [Bacteroidia bacterium]|jgi:decaprenylphospho-beta-D-ribofuranose 2-oxidase
MYPKVDAQVDEPAFVEDISRSLKSNTVLARGMARSYGDASLNDHVVSTLNCNRIIDFNTDSGELECEAGATLDLIIDLILPKGFFLPVTPGTKFVTVGGAIAADIHGKNHHIDGCFGKHVVFLDLLIEDGSVLRCSPEEYPDRFYKTIGGMGLSGVIVKARFRLKRVSTAYINQKVIKCRNLDEIMSAFENNQDSTYSVAWLDTSQTGKGIGKSVLLLGEHANESDLTGSKKNPLELPKKKSVSLPFNFPAFTINPLTIKVFNVLFYLKNRNTEKAIIDLDSYFYPLDAIHNWNRIYGKPGFTQYQFVIPMERSREGLQEILAFIAENKRLSFLTVLKMFGKADEKAKLSFPKEGYTLTIDLNVNKGIEEFIAGLDDLVEKYDGRVYFAKDAFSRLGRKDITRFNLKENRTFNSRLADRLTS